MNTKCNETVYTLCEGIAPERIEELCAMAPPDYFTFFRDRDVAMHFVSIDELTEKNHFDIMVRAGAEGRIECTLVAHDYSGLFALLVGVLSSFGMSIESGRAYTFRKKRESSKGKVRRGRPILHKTENHSYAVDYFSGVVASNRYGAEWVDSLTSFLSELFDGLYRGGRAEDLQRRVNEAVVSRLTMLGNVDEALYPAKIDITSGNSSATVLKVHGQDTPFFLYALTLALTQAGLSVEQVVIRTIGSHAVDTFHITGVDGRPIDDEESSHRLRIMVLLTRQFTYYLSSAPDPYSAIQRFRYLVQDIIQKAGSETLESLAQPEIFTELATVLGTSDYMWEDFIRLHYESILPMLKGDEVILEPVETLRSRLDDALSPAHSYDEKVRALNDFKDRELFRMDLDHILNSETDFLTLSANLSRLAEVIVESAYTLALEKMVKEFGFPKSVAGFAARSVIFGLGKLGGAALGYASDIELIFIYSDSGRCDGEGEVPNAKFYEDVVREITAILRSKKDGIFELDLRLRPYGKDGPLAVSLDSFTSYYGPSGEAHSYERLAQVRMRYIAGDEALARQVEAIRDEIIYMSDSVDPREIFILRESQYREKLTPGRINAKYSAGNLVDLEYTIQLLQVRYGALNENLRTPRMHKALEELARSGVIDESESGRLISAYHFFRRLINALRMLRGSAKDLYLPDVDSLEYAHLARRMGYRTWGDLSGDNQLFIELETWSATVRSFIERYIGRENLPDPMKGNVADLILSDVVAPEFRDTLLQRYGFKDTQKACHNLRSMASEGTQRDVFSGCAILAIQLMSSLPDRDMALNNWERFVSVRDDPVGHYRQMLAQPGRLEMMLRIYSTSQYLSDTLIDNSEYFEYIIDPQRIRQPLTLDYLREQLNADQEEISEILRSVKRRELLRIGVRDIVLALPFTEIVSDISILAEAVIEFTALFFLEKNTSPHQYQQLKDLFSIVAFGKLGGGELNYSSDIDIVALFDDSLVNDQEVQKCYEGMLEELASELNRVTALGHVYRVDLRLRPYGTSGTLMNSLGAMIRYYEEESSQWEAQALLKARPVAGNRSLGWQWIDGVRGIYSRYSPVEVTETILRLRNAAVAKVNSRRLGGVDIKDGEGGIRDIEFLVQGLQMIHVKKSRDFLQQNTLRALEVLRVNGILDDGDASYLSGEYIFFRRLEHFLQLLDNRQTHQLPKNEAEQSALAMRLKGTETSGDDFIQEVKERMAQIRHRFTQFISDYAVGLAEGRNS